MEDIYSLGRFFPSGVAVELLDEYVGHHLSSATRCVENELYSSAYSHLHLLYMAFIYIQLLRIAREKKKEFEYGWIGFPGEEKDFLNKPTSPFSFSGVKEQTVFRFFRLVGFDDGTIANIASVISTRNKRLHATGQLHCATADEFGHELNGYIKKMQFVINKQKSFFDEIYNGLLDTYEDGYVFTVDDLESNYHDQYLLSEYELVVLATGRNDMVSRFIQNNYS